MNTTVELVSILMYCTLVLYVSTVAYPIQKVVEAIICENVAPVLRGVNLKLNLNVIVRLAEWHWSSPFDRLEFSFTSGVLT